MPIGVPKVPYRMPGDESAQWVDLYNRLYRERILFLCQDLDDELANQLIGIMLYLNSENKSKEICIYINSPGGSVTCGVGVYDAMNYIQSKITTICVGTAASMASFGATRKRKLAGGTKGSRVALPHSRIMIHQPEGGSQGQATVVLSESEEVLRIRDEVAQIYADRTGQTLDRISRDMNRDQFLSAREAKAYGLVDQIVLALPK
uniref:ATP-dependent Clp protease proteolytic subunit n=1 Tax=Capsosiphon fulvescens TaxID=205396 RepID=A0A3G1RIU3_9CHLO|nr:proteolytic subunit 2 of clp protease [Capsosiphon fulvescens]AWX64066.1 proteolytic subunit 2 of clp protease [Capsosiphon fulvescens]AYV89983.1 proteolytic subunit 2 of clp protease [Capsosiphon fulvescens]